MYDVERTSYGLRLTISGQFSPDEAKEFVQEVKTQTRKQDRSFCVFADLRDMEAFPPEVGKQITELMEFCKDHGMQRSVDVVETATTSLQMEQLVDQAGINERIIDASTTDDPESQAIEWLEQGTEPDS